jgi:hypothetical protein
MNFSSCKSRKKGKAAGVGFIKYKIEMSTYVSTLKVPFEKSLVVHLQLIQSI